MATLTKKQKRENVRRVENGRTLVLEYINTLGGDGDFVYRDMLADLMHSAAADGVDWADELDSAAMHFAAERLGED